MAISKMNKYNKYKILKEDPALIPHLPQTRRMSESNFLTLIEKHKIVILKPASKWGGSGIIKVTQLKDDQYNVHSEHTKKTITGREELLRYIHRKAPGRYIVQQFIPLATMNGRPFDLRVMVQRKGGGDWHITGKLAKVAGKGYIVTNVARSGGSVHPLRWVITRSSMKGVSSSTLSNQIDKVALQTAARIKAYYPKERTLGIDIGVDDQGGIWIIEVNFYPALSLFQRLRDKSMYRKILHYQNGSG